MAHRTRMHYPDAFNLLNDDQILFFDRDFSLHDSLLGLKPEILAFGSNKPNRHIYLFYASLCDAFEQSCKTAYIYLPITYIGLDTSARSQKRKCDDQIFSLRRRRKRDRARTIKGMHRDCSLLSLIFSSFCESRARLTTVEFTYWIILELIISHDTNNTSL